RASSIIGQGDVLTPVIRDRAENAAFGGHILGYRASPFQSGIRFLKLRIGLGMWWPVVSCYS
ncbi:MAG TPA: hypothetical protein VHV10_00340, partial [Ktedonobacteraceae bacterium]|nr:hypothetical protein [Ktedonobacteraceae bacterium]